MYLPKYILRILICWYQNQRMCIRWGKAYSDCFSTSNGVRQGSLVSPHLFNVYVDELSVRLNGAEIGCSVGRVNVNHAMYADDLALIAPSTKGLQRLIDICVDYGSQHDVIFNAKKSAVMNFCSKALSLLCRKIEQIT